MLPMPPLLQIHLVMFMRIMQEKLLKILIKGPNQTFVHLHKLKIFLHKFMYLHLQNQVRQFNFTRCDKSTISILLEDTNTAYEVFNNATSDTTGSTSLIPKSTSVQHNYVLTEQIMGPAITLLLLMVLLFLFLHLLNFIFDMLYLDMIWMLLLKNLQP